MKIVLFKRKILTLLACAAAAALMFYVVNYPSVVGVYAADRPSAHLLRGKGLQGALHLL